MIFYPDNLRAICDAARLEEATERQEELALPNSVHIVHDEVEMSYEEALNNLRLCFRGVTYQ